LGTVENLVAKLVEQVFNLRDFPIGTPSQGRQHPGFHALS
jgi:hypothetical protein